MKKYFIILCIIFSSFQSYGQDTIFLKEVIIHNTKGNFKTLKTKGKQNGFYAIPEGVLFVGKVNVNKNFSGTLKDVTFFFSNERSLNPKDTKFELLIFDKDNKGFPDRLLVNSKFLIFKVSKTETGEVSIDLSSLNLKIKEDFFVGLRRLDKDTQWNFYIDIRHKKSNAIYLKLPGIDKWQVLNGKGIDMKIRYIAE